MSSRKRGESPEQQLFEFVERLPDLKAIIKRQPPLDATTTNEHRSLAGTSVSGSETPAERPANTHLTHEIGYFDALVFVVSFGLFIVLIADVIYDAGFAESILPRNNPFLRQLSFAAIGVANVVSAVFLYVQAISLRTRAPLDKANRFAAYSLVLLFVLLAALQAFISIALTYKDIWAVVFNIYAVIGNSQRPWR